MWQAFWIQNIHYVLEVFVAFFMVTAAWIYLDGWLIERKAKTLLRSLGFFILALWSLLDAAPLGLIKIAEIFDTERLVEITGVIGFAIVFVSLLIDPVPVKPGAKPIRFFSWFWGKALAILPVGLIPNFNELFSRIREIVQKIIPIILTALGILSGLVIELRVWMFLIAILITILLRLHYVRGIQFEWKYFWLGFLCFTFSLAFALGPIWQNSSNVLLQRILSPFHAVWIAEHVSKLIGALLLGVWAWGFIRFRIFPQIFSSFVALSFLIFVTMTVMYTGFLLNRTQESIIKTMEINIKTLDLALNKVKSSAILAARISASNPQVKEALRLNDKEALFANLNALMFENETDFMLAVNAGGEVLMRAQDKERFGDSVADDQVVWRALDGKAVVTTAAEQGVTISTVSIKAASPVIDTSQTGEPKIIGTIITGFLLDTAFVDGIKKITDLDVTIFANDVSIATTFTDLSNDHRLIGVRELDQDILTTVLKEQKAYTGSALLFNRPFLAAYIPILDIEETPIGMFFTGRSQASILGVAGDTMRLTFSISILLMILSIPPIWWLARFISYNQQV